MLDVVLVNFCPLSTTAGAQLKNPALHPEGWVRIEKRGRTIDYNVSSWRNQTGEYLTRDPD